MYRFFKSYSVDGSVNHIWVENKGNNAFSQGIEFKDLIAHENYLHRLFNLTIMMAKINKPVLGHVKGWVGGAAAYLLKILPTPFGSSNAYLSF